MSNVPPAILTIADQRPANSVHEPAAFMSGSGGME
jgi:hypothetical protein